MHSTPEGAEPLIPRARRPRSQAGLYPGTPSRGTGAPRKARACTEGKLPTPAPREQPSRNPNYSMGHVGMDHSGPASRSTGYRTASRWFPTISSDGDFTAILSNLFQCTAKFFPLFRRNADPGEILAVGRGGLRGRGGRRGPGQSVRGGRRSAAGRAGQSRARVSLTRLRSRAACSRWKSRRAREPGRCLSAQRLMALQKPAAGSGRRALYGGRRGTNSGGPAPRLPPRRRRPRPRPGPAQEGIPAPPARAAPELRAFPFRRDRHGP